MDTSFSKYSLFFSCSLCGTIPLVSPSNPDGASVTGGVLPGLLFDDASWATMQTLLVSVKTVFRKQARIQIFWLTFDGCSRLVRPFPGKTIKPAKRKRPEKDPLLKAGWVPQMLGRAVSTARETRVLP